MGKKSREYQTRIVKPDTREPIPETKTEDKKTYQTSVPSVFVPLVKCPNALPNGQKCEGTVWRDGGTSYANPETREMCRYRKCVRCGKAHWQRKPMTEAQIKEYCPAQ